MGRQLFLAVGIMCVIVATTIALAGVVEARLDECSSGCGTLNYFYGKVTDETGYALRGARVLVFYLSYTGVCCIFDYTFTYYDGSYVLPLTIADQRFTYHFEVTGPDPWARYEVPGRNPTNLYVTSYWTHDRTRVGIGRTDFVLPRNAPAYFYDFAHLSTPGYTTFTVSYTKSHAVRVYCFGCGPLGLDLDYSWSESSTLTYSSRMGAASLARRNWVMSTGIFHTDASGNNPRVDTTWLYGNVYRQEIVDNVADALRPTDVGPSMPDQTIPPGASFGAQHTEAGSITVSNSLEVSVGLNLGPLTISKNLGVGYSTQDSSSYTSGFTVTNTDSIARTFRVYYEHSPTYGLVIHVWRL